MADIINLRLARKARDRAAAETTAAANRAKHGQTRAERASRKSDEARAQAHIDGHRLPHRPDEA